MLVGSAIQPRPENHIVSPGAKKKLKENIQERAFQAREIEEETASKSNKDHNWPRDHNKAVVSEGLKMKAKDRLWCCLHSLVLSPGVARQSTSRYVKPKVRKQNKTPKYWALQSVTTVLYLAGRDPFLQVLDVPRIPSPQFLLKFTQISFQECKTTNQKYLVDCLLNFRLRVPFCICLP